jgi:hypothetical protein
LYQRWVLQVPAIKVVSHYVGVDPVLCYTPRMWLLRKNCRTQRMRAGIQEVRRSLGVPRASIKGRQSRRMSTTHGRVRTVTQEVEYSPSEGSTPSRNTKAQEQTQEQAQAQKQEQSHNLTVRPSPERQQQKNSATEKNAIQNSLSDGTLCHTHRENAVIQDV